MAHLGTRVSALLDGRLSAADEERCWAHVQECHPCRDLVEREGWVKTSLAQLSMGPAAASESLKSSLRAPDTQAWLAAAPFPGTGRTRSRGLLAIGGSAAGACVIGVLALGLSGPTRSDPRPPVTNISRPAGPVAPTVVGSDPQRRPTPRPSSRAPLAERVVAVREKMGP